MENILVVDDEKEICFAISKLLELNGYQTFQAYNGSEAIEILNSEKIDLIIMDVMMPELDGITALSIIRKENFIPIIMLSAKSESSDKILGLEYGADDYITKPYEPAELVARVKSNLRRVKFLQEEPINSDEVIVNGNLVLDLRSKEAIVDGEVIKLTAKEYGILHLLMSNLDKVFSAETIYQTVWQEDAFAVENTVMVHIRRIRKKLEPYSKHSKYIKVVWGIGYKIEKQ